MPNKERKLRSTKIRRKGSSQPVNAFYPATNAVLLNTGYDDMEQHELWLEFDAAASGGTTFTDARTDYRILIGTGDYAAILKAMCDVDEGVALSAMADELAARLRTKP